jgi:hypothetical protein
MRAKEKIAKHNVIGLVYDFDGTLSPNNMQEDTIFRSYGVEKSLLWKKSAKLVRQGYERTLAYLKLLIHDPVFQQRPLDRKELRKLAVHIRYFPGVTDYFKNIRQFLRSIPEVREWGITLEHYVISSGMIEILEGSLIYPHFKKVYACEYDYDEAGPIFPKLVINDTNKTQFLFRINKGKLNIGEDINSHMPESQRRIPFRNMVYLGDSRTDIPSMTLVQRYGGHTIAVFNPAFRVPKLVRDMVEKRRVDHFAPADYRPGSLLFKIIQRTIRKIVHDIAYFNSMNMSLHWVRSHKKPVRRK